MNKFLLNAISASLLLLSTAASAGPARDAANSFQKRISNIQSDILSSNSNTAYVCYLIGDLSAQVVRMAGEAVHENAHMDLNLIQPMNEDIRAAAGYCSATLPGIKSVPALDKKQLNDQLSSLHDRINHWINALP